MCGPVVDEISAVLAGPPPIETDSVNGTAGLEEGIDRVWEFALAAVGGLDGVAGVEDRGRKRVEPIITRLLGGASGFSTTSPYSLVSKTP